MFIFKALYHINSIIRILFLKFLYGKNLHVGKRVNFRKGFTLMLSGNAKVSIGDFCFFNNYCSIVAHRGITIGNGTILGESVKIYDHNHRYSNVDIPIKVQGYSSEPIVIGEHCWIGSNVMILKGSKIGKNCVIGAGCIVYEDIPDNTILINKQELIRRTL